MTQELNTARSKVMTKSTVLGLDDAKRFQLVKALRDSTINPQTGPVTCHTMLHLRPNTQWGAMIWDEMASFLSVAGWQLEGGRTPETYYPAGVALSTSKDSGEGFNCAFRLSEILSDLQALIRYE